MSFAAILAIAFSEFGVCLRYSCCHPRSVCWAVATVTTVWKVLWVDESAIAEGEFNPMAVLGTGTGLVETGIYGSRF